MRAAVAAEEHGIQTVRPQAQQEINQPSQAGAAFTDLVIQVILQVVTVEVEVELVE
jgi:hypothetical protein